MIQTGVGYIPYIILLFFVTGLLMQLHDARTYRFLGMKREAKYSRILGWINVALGAGLMVSQWFT